MRKVIAIISICRYSKEGWDRKGEENDGDFYLSLEEQKLVEEVKSRFARIVVVLNVGGMVDSSWFKEEPRIQSVLLAWHLMVNVRRIMDLLLWLE